MSLFPFLSVLFLIINPALLWLFKRFDQNLQKLQFWAMLTSGMAWLISLVFFFYTPDQHLNPIWNAGEQLLPSLAFSLDWVSSSFFLALTTLIFFAILTEGHSPQTNAWFSGLGAICVIGTLADSAYTLALVWAAVEALALYSYLKNQGKITESYRYIFAILARLTGPLLVIYISLVTSSTGIAPFLTELPSSAAPFLLAAGVIGFWGWFLTPEISREVQSEIRPGKYLSWTPAILGLVLVTRSSQIFIQDEVSYTGILVGAILIFLVFLLSLILNSSEKNWKYGTLALIFSGALFAAPQAVLTWAVIFLLPGLVLFKTVESKRTASLALIAGGIGILPLPFFPAWLGLSALHGIPGLFFSLLAGLFLGRIINHRVQDWRRIENPTEPLSPMTLTGYAVILISLYSITFQVGLVQASLALSSVPLSAWLAALLFGVSVLFWDRIPELNLFRFDGLRTRARRFSQSAGGSLRRFADGAVYLFTRLFEGDGGLIWTLLLGFLLITLISLRGR